MTLAATAACGGRVTEPPPRPLRMVSAVPSGSEFTKALATLYATELRGLAPEVMKSGGVVESLDMLERGEADIGFSLANVAYGAFIGDLPDRKMPYGQLRSIALLRRSALHVLVGPRSSIRGMDDVHGHTVKFSGPGAAVALTAESVLSAFALDPSEIIDPASDAGSNALADLLAGRLDVLVNLGAPPLELVENALAAGARLLPVEGEPIERLVREYPFYSVMVIPRDVYTHLPAPVITIGVDGLLLARSDVPDDVVYELTKALYGGPLGMPSDPALTQWVDVSIGAATPIPLHPGAARFYRERELSP